MPANKNNLRRDLLATLIAREKEKQKQKNKKQKTKNKTKQKLQSQKITDEKKTIIMTLSKTLNTRTTTVYASLISLATCYRIFTFCIILLGKSV